MKNQTQTEPPGASPLRVLPLAFKGERFAVGARWRDHEMAAPKANVAPPVTDLVNERMERILQEPLNAVEFLPTRLITSPTNLEALDVSDVDCLIVMAVDGESQGLIQYLANFEDMPMVFYGAQEHMSHTLFAGYGAVSSRKTIVALDAADVRRQLKVQAVLKRMRQSTIVLFGGVSDSVVDNPTDLNRLKTVFGVKIDRVTISHLQERVAQVDSAKAACRAKSLAANASKIEDINEADIYETSALSLAAQNLAQEAGADAMAIDCTCLFDEGGVAPCVALHDFEAKNIPAACEGDVNCLLLKMILTYLTGAPTFMGNIGPLNVDKGTITVWHHTSPATMFKNGEYSLGSYAGRGVKLIGEVEVPMPVTVVKLNRNLQRATVLEGTVIHSALDRDCMDLEIQIPDLRLFVNKHLLGNHHVVALGHHGEDVAAVLETAGVETFLM